MESCAACGKADISLKSCNACKLVKYCGVDCQVAHRPVHKKACRKQAAELFDGKLFAEPPRREDCVICCITMPFAKGEICNMNCCGKNICGGCRYSLPREYCPFCNTASSRSLEESNRRRFKRIEKYNDPEAMVIVGFHYVKGTHGFTVDLAKAIELYQRASDLGSAGAHYNLGSTYFHGLGGVHVDTEKAIHHYQMAAMMGNINARCTLGSVEEMDGNRHRAFRHFMIAARCGHDHALETVKKGFMEGDVTKEDFEKTLRQHKASQDEIKSDQRDRGRAARGR